MRQHKTNHSRIALSGAVRLWFSSWLPAVGELRRISWNLPSKHINRFFLRCDKEHVFPLVALVNKIFQRLACVMGVIAENCNASAVIDVLLQNLARQPGAENKKSSATNLLSITIFFVPIS